MPVPHVVDDGNGLQPERMKCQCLLKFTSIASKRASLYSQSNVCVVLKDDNDSLIIDVLGSIKIYHYVHIETWICQPNHRYLIWWLAKAQGGGGYLEAMSDVKVSKASSSVFPYLSLHMNSSRYSGRWPSWTPFISFIFFMHLAQ